MAVVNGNKYMRYAMGRLYSGFHRFFDGNGFYRGRIPPRGSNLAADIARWFPVEIETIFDVGANVGQSTRQYLKVFPKATIYSFEPAPPTFIELCDNLGHHKNVVPCMMAFSDKTGRENMIYSPSRSDLARLSRLPFDAYERELHFRDAVEIEVEVETVDHFCQKHGIGCINLLKIDTEGNDLNVLIGAYRMLAEKLVDLVEVEAGMSPYNCFHCPFSKLVDYLDNLDYHLFGIYEQVGEPGIQWILRRVNPVFTYWGRE